MSCRIKFKSICSGSCGNCYWLGMEDSDGSIRSIVIDAGASPRALRKSLEAEGLAMEDIKAIFITHDHVDHIRSLSSYCKHCTIPVWTTPLLHKALQKHTFTRDHIEGNCRELGPGWNPLEAGRIRVKYFEVPHDATQTVGYAIMMDDFKFVIMTDIGHMTKEGIDYARQADAVVIESNYDLEMLRNGPYPLELQDRICLGNGHLSNAQCAQAIREFSHTGLRYIFLCHLSEHNNTPQKALEANREAVCRGERLIALPRKTASPLFHLNY